MTSGGRKIVVACVLVGGLGCGGQLPEPTTMPLAVDGEGLPLAAALPLVSGSCGISSPPYRVVETASWDAPTRTFTMGALYWKLDDHGRVVEYAQTGGEWRHLMTRDEHGVLTTFTYEWNGSPHAENSWDQTNSYDANGLLTGSVLAYRSGARQVDYTYLHDDQSRLTNVKVRSQEGEQTTESSTQLHWSNGKLITRTRAAGSPLSALQGNDTRYYHDDGRLGTIDVDGAGLAPGADGLIDMRRTWAYDTSGRVVRQEQDGTEILDAPVIDGVPDSVTTFDPSCAAIAVLPHQLYGLESWTRLP